MKIHVLSLFPEVFPGVLGVSIVGRAFKKGLAELKVHDLRKFGIINNNCPKAIIDDTPFGGGSGMVIRCDVIDRALEEIGLQAAHKIFMSPRGDVFNQGIAQALTKIPKDILILCGRYEGVDQRVLDYWNFVELSIGEFVLCGGEVAAMVVIEACVRLVDGVVGNPESLVYESFSNNLLEHNQYTQPAIWEKGDKKLAVPDVLRSGDHRKVDAYRKAEARELTIRRKKR